jgi:dipeptidyl aminopeptidase/acylaminoacyl peptidase
MKKIVLAFLFTLITNVVYATKAPLDYQQFGHLPMVTLAKVSPDGDHIAALLNNDDGPAVVVSQFGKKQLTTLIKLKKSQDRIDEIYWANNERIIVSSSYSKKLYGDRIRVNRLFAVNIDGTDLIELKKKHLRDLDSTEMLLKDVNSSSQIISLVKDDKEHVLIQAYSPNDKGQSVFKVNIYKNQFNKLFVNKYNVSSWVADQNSEVVLGVGLDKNDPEITNIYSRANNQANWQLLHTRKGYEGDTFTPLYVKKDKAIVLTDRESQRQSLWQYDIPSGTFDSLLYGHKLYDVSGAILDIDNNKVIGAEYYDNYRQVHYFDDKDVTVATTVQNSFKQYQTTIASMSEDKTKILVAASRDNSPEKYFWLDLTINKGGFWFSQYPYLESQSLAGKIPFEFTASDGMSLNGYLTLPTKVKYKGKNAPLVVLPHGGPIGVRDYQSFDPYVQYIAHLGYAVLQVNFRGSGGFGNAYETSGYRNWGKLMQQDVYDAIAWLAGKSLVDTKNSCMVGFSYGGYVALTSSFQKPEQFKCIVSVAGISDINQVAANLSKYKSYRPFINKTMGNINDQDTVNQLATLSAINNLNKIKTPILLMHGKHDTRVKFTQSANFYTKAKQAGLKADYIEFEQGTHFLDENENRLAAFRAMGEFLNKHL